MFHNGHTSLEEEIGYTYYSSTECESDFEYEGKAGYICEPEYSKEELGKLFFKLYFSRSSCYIYILCVLSLITLKVENN